jgi:hypothetical protein
VVRLRLAAHAAAASAAVLLRAAVPLAADAESVVAVS